jgi:hypothetical protein
MINIEEVEMLVRWYAEDATKLVIMKNIVIVIIYQILSNIQHMQSILMIKMMILQNMFLLHFKINNFRRFPFILLKVIMKMLGSRILELLNI